MIFLLTYIYFTLNQFYCFIALVTMILMINLLHLVRDRIIADGSKAVILNYTPNEQVVILIIHLPILQVKYIYF